MKRLLLYLTLCCLCACTGSKSSLPNGVYNIKLGETYTESQLIAALNKDTFRNFKVWHSGDSFLPGMHDTFYKSEENGVISYSGSKNTTSADFSFLDCKWSKFNIDTDSDGKIVRITFSQGTTFSTTPLDLIQKDYNALLIKLHNLYGASEDSNVDGKQTSIWLDESTSIKVEYWEFQDYKNEPNAILTCELSACDNKQ